MKLASDSRGFTILELLFFVVISSALIFIPLRILRGRDRDVQFNDATRTIQAIMQREYNNTLNGVNVGNKDCVADPPNNRYTANNFSTKVTYDFSGAQDNDGSCIFLGSVVEFGQLASTSPGDEERRTMTIYQIVGLKMTQDELDQCKGSLPAGISESRAVLYCMQPTRKKTANNVDYVKETITIPWGVEIIKKGHHDNNGLAFFRDPQRSRIMPVGFEDGYTDYENFKEFTAGGADSSNANTRVDVDAEYSGYVCFGNPGDRRDAYIGVGSGARQEVIELKYDLEWSGVPVCE